jgi:aspartyl-tRNA(Asn)/glutamyl-tRNA(Gln) amidotransferase subunit B
MALTDFQVVVGLEVHAQLLTQSKLFAPASTRFGAEPNSQTQPLCLGLPGTLPVLNEKVVEMAVRTGLGLSCKINEVSVWSRKHYFYPDLPKGYQITQYEQPICEWGSLGFELEGAEKSVRIRRIHIEEDAGKSIHDAGGPMSLVDLNRAGTPLLEIVSEPDLRSSDEAVEYLKALREVLVYLGVNDGNLEEGSFRCDANVSVMRKGASEYGTRTELKNLNSFRFIKQAIEWESARHIEVIENGGKVDQQTRLWDPSRNETRAMRSKEDAHDYRYFPEPDLPPLKLEPGYVERQKGTLPELPRARRRRFVEAWKLAEADARIIVADKPLADFFEATAAHAPDARKLANWFNGELQRLFNESGTSVASAKFSPAQLGALLTEVERGTISGNAGKDVLGEMFRSGREPAAIIADKGLGQVSDSTEIERIVDEILARHPTEADQFRAGKQQVLGFFVGQAMKAMKGKGNPKLVNDVLRRKLGKPAT